MRTVEEIKERLNEIYNESGKNVKALDDAIDLEIPYIEYRKLGEAIIPNADKGTFWEVLPDGVRTPSQYMAEILSEEWSK